MSTGPLAPTLIVLPLTLVAMLPIAAYISVLREVTADAVEAGPVLRRRVRLTSAWCGLITIPLAGFGLGVVSPATPTAFVLVWTLVGALVVLQLVLAMIDLVVTGRQARELARAKREAIEVARSAALHARAKREQEDASYPFPKMGEGSGSDPEADVGRGDGADA